MAKRNIPATTIIPFLLRTCAIGAAFALSGCACNYPDVSPTSQRHWTLGTATSSAKAVVRLPSRRPPGFNRPRQQRPADPASKLILDLYLNEPRGE